jgi:hypothetical protein
LKGLARRAERQSRANGSQDPGYEHGNLLEHDGRRDAFPTLPLDDVDAPIVTRFRPFVARRLSDRRPTPKDHRRLPVPTGAQNRVERLAIVRRAEPYRLRGASFPLRSPSARHECTGKLSPERDENSLEPKCSPRASARQACKLCRGGGAHLRAAVN